MSMYNKIRKPIGIWPTVVVLIIAVGMLVMIVMGMISSWKTPDTEQVAPAKTPVSHSTQPG